MSKFSNAALRLTAGALILDAGVKKLVRDLSVTLRQVILREIF